MCGDATVNPRTWNCVKVPNENDWLTARWRADPFPAKQGVDLRKALMTAQAQMRVEDLDVDPAHIDGNPYRAARLKPLQRADAG
jgi:hypothetical protein